MKRAKAHREPGVEKRPSDPKMGPHRPSHTAPHPNRQAGRPKSKAGGQEEKRQNRLQQQKAEGGKGAVSPGEGSGEKVEDTSDVHKPVLVQKSMGKCVLLTAVKCLLIGYYNIFDVAM